MSEVQAVLTLEELALYARNLSVTHLESIPDGEKCHRIALKDLSGQTSRLIKAAVGSSVKRRFLYNERVIRKLYEEFSATDKAESSDEDANNVFSVETGALWLLDNYHLIERQMLETKSHFSSSFSTSLPIIESSKGKSPLNEGTTIPPNAYRIYHLAHHLVYTSDAMVDSDRLTIFFKNYQEGAPLKSAEVWAAPLMMRFALIENLRVLLENIASMRKSRLSVESLLSDILEGSNELPSAVLVAIISRLNRVPVSEISGTTGAHIIRYLRSRASSYPLALKWFEDRLKEIGVSAEEVISNYRANQARVQVSIGNTVISLRTLATIRWKEWFEDVSLVHQALLKEPLGVYPLSDFRTRDYVRHLVEKQAKRRGITEIKVVEEALHEIAQNYSEQSKSNLDVEALQKQNCISTKLSITERESRFLAKFRNNAASYRVEVYLATIGLFTIGQLTLLSVYLIRTLPYTTSWNIFLIFILTALALLPASDISIRLVQWFLGFLVTPKLIPKYDYSQGIPNHCRTLVAVQNIFSNLDDVKEAVERLFVRYLANSDNNLYFAIIADLPDIPGGAAKDLALERALAQDEAIIKCAYEEIARLNLNAGYGTPHDEGARKFNILFRKRLWNGVEEKWMGWERKRGKIEELNRLIIDGERAITSFMEIPSSWPRDIRYVITLDGDTLLPNKTAVKLIGAISHPVNTPLFNEDGRVIDGYGIIQPRVSSTLTSATKSLFSSVFSYGAGLDPYVESVSDFYQDVFGESIYGGKGIYDVRAFHRATHNRFPENAILSHDLIESCFARCGLASDLEIFDDFPANYASFAKRAHRWIRGDFQLLPFLKSNLPLLSQWKIIDNVRRSLVTPALFFLLLFTFVALPINPLFPLAVVLLILGFPLYTELVQIVIAPPLTVSLALYLKGLSKLLWHRLAQAFCLLLLLPKVSWSTLHAAGVTLIRVYYTRRNLLEWTPFKSIENVKSSREDVLLENTFGLLALGGFLVSLFFDEGVAYAIPSGLVTLWIASPIILRQLERPPYTRQESVNNRDKLYLQGIFRDTWVFLREHLNQKHNFLIPDNLQLFPQPIIASRTSPTNIGLSMVCVGAAYRAGLESLPGAVRLIASILHNVDSLERVRGHLLNWYNTESKEPLLPRYISSVDSGNFLGSLMTVRGFLQSFATAPIIDLEAVRLLELNLNSDLPFNLQKTSPQLHRQLRLRLHELITLFTLNNLRGVSTLVTRVLNVLEEDGRGIEVTKRGSEVLMINGVSVLHLATFLDIAKYLSWIDEFYELPTLVTVKKYAGPLLGAVLALEESLNKEPTLPNLRECIVAALNFVEQAMTRLVEERKVAHSIEEPSTRSLNKMATTLNGLLADIDANSFLVKDALVSIEMLEREMDFSFLLSKETEMFAVGYHVDSGRKDSSTYDMLASEARLTSFVAIAKGDVPYRHWFSLSRNLTHTAAGKGLVSWSGTTFEYLMPLLFMRSIPGTLLDESYRVAIGAQRHYVSRFDIPWGISESAYSRVDVHGTYQYRAFGVPDLGLKRGLKDDLVISPYSSIMATMVDTQSSIANLRKLESIGARGEYGFFESIDFTPDRLTGNEDKHIVTAYFAHHQGMSLLSLANVLYNNCVQDWLHCNPRIIAIEELLHEKFPTRVELGALSREQSDNTLSLRTRESEDDALGVGTVNITSYQTPIPVIHILSNKSLTSVVDNSGSGFLLFDGEIALNRWRSDPALNNHGVYLYINDIEQKRLWSATYQPTLVTPDFYQAIFNPDKVEFKRTDYRVHSHLEITVSQEDNSEVRRLTLSNLANKRKSLCVTSYAEVALNSIRADSSHVAFSKMFVESEYLSDYDAIICSRRPRSLDEASMFLVHLVSLPTVFKPTEFDTSRASFIGRRNDVRAPISCTDHGGKGGVSRLAGNHGPVLDPAFALRTYLELESGTSQTITFVTAYAKTRQEAIHLAARYHDQHHVRRAFEMSWSQSSIELRLGNLDLSDTLFFQRLGTALFFPARTANSRSSSVARNRLGQSALWRLGISGDLPIVLLKLTDFEQLSLVRQLIAGHTYLTSRRIAFDLVILNEQSEGYLQRFSEEVDNIKRALGSVSDSNRGSIFMVHLSHMSPDEVVLLECVSRIIFDANLGLLENQLDISLHSEEKESASEKPVVTLSTIPIGEVEIDPELQFYPQGGITRDGRGFALVVDKERSTTVPFSNVLANRKFGTLVTESGGGYTWSQNSRENRLTPFTNDPITDRVCEALYIKDDSNGAFFTATPGGKALPGGYLVTHEFGRSVFETRCNMLNSRLEISVAEEMSVKWLSLELTNLAKGVRNLSLFYYLEPVLGVLREQSKWHLNLRYANDLKAILITNGYNNEFSGSTVYVGSSGNVRAHLCDRVDFIGANGTLDNPRYIRNHQEARRADTTFNVPTSSAWPRINNKALGANFDPCALLECGVTLSPRGSSNSSVKLLFFLGECEAVDQLSAHVNYARSFKAHRESEKARQERFKEELFSIQVRTPDRAFDVLMNGWLLYQTKGARLDGRTGFYQSGGAFGFRDQLQDVLAFLNNKPQLAREQILLHAAHQFIEGDVQHWWHPPTGRGVRTKISDDYLWLPYVVAKYLTVTGDLSLLDEEVPFLEGRELGESEEAYFQPGISPELGNIKEHCLRALHRGLELRSARGLPLMGSGDWNDGMNRVGRHGTGESIWLGWFLGASLLEFAPWLENSDPSTASYFRKEAQALKEALNLHGFDGEWYRRAYFDDGTPLGSSSNKECKIDSVAQSWSVISGLGEPEKSQQGFNSLLKYLVDEESKIIKLLTPAFGEVSEENEGSNRLDPGYIAGYLPGVRENGGQYTHAAAWSVIAASMLGLKDEAYKLFSIINPLTHALSKEGQERYQGEPYVLCGDVYGVFPHVGKAGWSWYTGSAGWLYQAGLHYILGLRVTHEGLSIADTLPGAWNESAITYNRKGSLITVRIERGNEKGHYIVSNSGRLTKVSTPIPWPTKGEDLTVIRVV